MPPTNYFGVEPPAGRPRLYASSNVEVSVEDVRSKVGSFAWDREGIAVVNDPAGAMNATPDAAGARETYPQIASLLERLTGARRAVIYNHVVRSSTILALAESEDNTRPAAQISGQTGFAQPVLQLHNDVNTSVAADLLRRHLPTLASDEPLEEVLRGHHAVVNFWRATNGPVEQLPLAICDKRTLDPQDLVPARLQWPTHADDTYAVTYNPNQRWYYVSALRPEEALVFCGYDSAAKDGHFCNAHGAFIDPTASHKTPRRDSFEARAILLF